MLSRAVSTEGLPRAGVLEAKELSTCTVKLSRALTDELSTITDTTAVLSETTSEGVTSPAPALDWVLDKATATARRVGVAAGSSRAEEGIKEGLGGVEGDCSITVDWVDTEGSPMLEIMRLMSMVVVVAWMVAVVKPEVGGRVAVDPVGVDTSV